MDQTAKNNKIAKRIHRFFCFAWRTSRPWRFNLLEALRNRLAALRQRLDLRGNLFHKAVLFEFAAHRPEVVISGPRVAVQAENDAAASTILSLRVAPHER